VAVVQVAVALQEARILQAPPKAKESVHQLKGSERLVSIPGRNVKGTMVLMRNGLPWI